MTRHEILKLHELIADGSEQAPAQQVAATLTLAIVIAEATDRLLGESGEWRRSEIETPGTGLAGIITELIWHRHD